jgi:hypothetical protein
MKVTLSDIFKNSQTYHIDMVNFNAIQNIIEVLYELTGIDYLTMCSDWRKREVVDARHMFMILAFQRTKLNRSTIASMVNRDHSTFAASKKKMDNLIETEIRIKKLFLECNRLLDERNVFNQKVINRKDELKESLINHAFKVGSVYVIEYKLVIKKIDALYAEIEDLNNQLINTVTNLEDSKSA